MRFTFCSGGDCPLWALAGLNALGSLPAPIFRNLLQHVVEEQPDDGVMDILKNTSLSSRDESARAVAVIRWVLLQSWRCSCQGPHITRDLLVMGVPKTHATALAEAADSNRNSHVSQVQSNGFMVNKITDVKISNGPDGLVDTYKLTMFTDDTFTGAQQRKELLIDKKSAKSMLTELKKVYDKLELLNGKENENEQK